MPAVVVLQVVPFVGQQAAVVLQVQVQREFEQSLVGSGSEQALVALELESRVEAAQPVVVAQVVGLYLAGLP